MLGHRVCSHMTELTGLTGHMPLLHGGASVMHVGLHRSSSDTIHKFWFSHVTAHAMCRLLASCNHTVCCLAQES